MFPSVAALARVWLDRSPSNTFQERVFSTGAPLPNRSRTETRRVKKQLLMKHNRKELRKIHHAERRSSGPQRLLDG
ncbi:hypothetical protein GN958_ATG10038 [Phytophthora infestans]|uniref:HAT C-terminal dimerisation domain-containing protein n=1 Tax=Phytophthora infestans TaxID=4787 RepID=A0A8S9UR51_PHYIN|nr:hypothetical protein GN958_ATG10038 [Phytophthora infestans]